MGDEARTAEVRVQDELKEPRRRRAWKWVVLAALVLVVAAAASVALDVGGVRARSAGAQEPVADNGTESAADAESETSVPVEVLTLQTGEISAYIGATANLVAEKDVTVVSETEGRVTVLRVEEGDVVREGDVLAVLDREEAQIAVRKAEAREENARHALERSVDLLARDLVTRADHENVRVEHEVADQELAEARWRLERNTFRAPFAGIVTSRSVQVGQHIRPGDELFRVTDLDPLIARIHLPETEVLALSVGRPVRIALNADPTVRFPGRIRQISPVVDTATGTVTVTIEAHDAPANVRPGSFVAVNIVSQSRADRVLLPRQAVLRELQASHVFVAKEGVAERRRVELGLEEGEWVEGLAGVEAGERVVVAGQGGLRDGARIRVLAPDEGADG